MATTWGAYEGHEAVGIDVSMSPATVTKDTASVTLTWSAYVKTDGWTIYADDQVLTASNTLADTVGFEFGTTASPPTPAGSARLIKSWTQTIATSHTATVTRTLSAAVSGMFNGGTPSHTRAITIPIRPPLVPSPATSATATYVSDTRVDLSWVRPANAGSAGTIWTNVDVWRSVDGGAYAAVAALAGTTTSWSDTTVSANHSYRYCVRGRNVSGSSAWTYTGTVDTTPAAPTNVAAVKSGTSITVTWTDNSPANETFEVRDNGGAVIGTATSATFTHTSPSPSITHQYQVRAVATDGGTRYSAWSVPSNTVQLLAAPNAPTGLVPNGAVQDAALGATLTWTHNPVDTTPQRLKQVRYRLDSGAWVELAAQTSSVASWDFTPSLMTGAALVEWQVRTAGDYTTGTVAEYSPWSASASFPVSLAPTVAITTPANGGTVTAPSVSVSWAYAHATLPQSAWEVTLTRGAETLWVATGSTESAWSTPLLLEDGSSYVVAVRVRSSAGLWSAVDSAAFTVSFPPPLAPLVTSEWVNEAGFMSVKVAGQSDGVAPVPVSYTLERATAGGSWVVLAEALPIDAEFLDFTVPLGGDATYRVTAISALPSTVRVEHVATVAATPCDVYLSGGPAFETTLRLVHAIRAEIESGRERVLRTYAGQADPTETSGAGMSRSVSVSAVLIPDSTAYATPPTRDDVLALFDLPGPHLYRDHEGLTMYVSLSRVSVGREWAAPISFTATRTSAGTPAQRAAMAAGLPPRVVEVRPGQYAVVGGTLVNTGPGVWGLA